MSKSPNLIPVVNRDVRVFRIVRYTREGTPDLEVKGLPETLPTDTQKLTPGLCWVDEGRIDDVKALSASSGGAVDFIALANLSPRQRTEIIDLTTDPFALKIWKTYETKNADIRRQLNDRLRAMGEKV